MKDGVIVINKPKGFTSFDVVGKLRGILKTKKMGHTGTLDPDATGVLPVCIGRATKLVEYLTDKTKIYKAKVLFGITTDTLDLSGTVLDRKEVNITKEDIERVISTFIGDISQIPPMYSAIKVNGQRLYDLARRGEEIERKPRQITISSIEINNIALPYIDITISCSKGTYIRTLCDDIGKKLGCGATMAELERVKSGSFHLDEALTFEEIEGLMESNELDNKILSIEDILCDLEKVYGTELATPLLENGNPVSEDFLLTKPLNKRVLMYLNNKKLVGIYEYNEQKKLYYPNKMFYTK